MAEGHSGVSLGSLVPRDSDIRSQAYEEHVLIRVRAITMEHSLHIRHRYLPCHFLIEPSQQT